MKAASVLCAACVISVLLFSSPVQALQCGAGTFEFYGGGGIKSCRIEANHQFWTGKGERIVCAAGSKVELEADGTLKGCGKAN